MTKLEEIARAIAACRSGDPDTLYDGMPVWMKALPDARAAVEAMREAPVNLDFQVALLEKNWQAMIDAILNEQAG